MIKANRNQHEPKKNYLQITKVTVTLEYRVDEIMITLGQ